MIFGNSLQQIQVISFLKERHKTIALVGPEHVGKASFVRYIVEENIHPTDFLFMEDGIDGVRDAVNFCRSAPLNGEHRVLIIDNSGSLSEPAQDALLKITEEPHDFLKIIFIVHDVGHLQSSLKSRLRYISNWHLLSSEEMNTFALTVSAITNRSLISLSDGRPGFYKSMMESSGVEDLYDFILRIAKNQSHPFLQNVPEIVKTLKGASIQRDVVVHVLNKASRHSDPVTRSLPILRFCNTLQHSVSANAELHWMRMAAHLSDVI